MAIAILNRRLIVGWRTESINHVLDICATLPWGMYIDHDPTRLSPDSLGRLQRKWSSRAEKERAFKINNRESYMNGKQRERDKMKADYATYCEQYMEMFPESEPVSYRVFAKLGLAPKWRKDPKLAVLSSYRIPSEIHKASKKGEPPTKIV